MRKNQFLNKDVTIRKKNNSFVRGICVDNNSTGIFIKLKEHSLEGNREKVVFVPWLNIEEIVTSYDG